MRDTISWVKLLMLYLGNGTPLFISSYFLKNSVCMFNDSCSRLLLTTAWSSMWSTIWSSMWSYAVWKQYPTNVDCFDSTIHLVVAIVALSTDCGFKVITTNFYDMSHDVDSHDGLMADNDITSEVDRTLDVSDFPLCAICTQLDLDSTEQMLCVGNRISSQRLILVRGNCLSIQAR